MPCRSNSYDIIDRNCSLEVGLIIADFVFDVMCSAI